MVTVSSQISTKAVSSRTSINDVGDVKLPELASISTSRVTFMASNTDDSCSSESTTTDADTITTTNSPEDEISTSEPLTSSSYPQITLTLSEEEDEGFNEDSSSASVNGSVRNELEPATQASLMESSQVESAQYSLVASGPSEPVSVSPKVSFNVNIRGSCIGSQSRHHHHIIHHHFPTSSYRHHFHHHHHHHHYLPAHSYSSQMSPTSSNTHCIDTTTTGCSYSAVLSPISSTPTSRLLCMDQMDHNSIDPSDTTSKQLDSVETSCETCTSDDTNPYEVNLEPNDQTLQYDNEHNETQFVSRAMPQESLICGPNGSVRGKKNTVRKSINDYIHLIKEAVCISWFCFNLDV